MPRVHRTSPRSWPDNVGNSVAAGLVHNNKDDAMFAAYADLDGNGFDDTAGDHDALSVVSARARLAAARAEAECCLICLEPTGNEDAVWHCAESCHAVYHLMCIQAWGKQQLAAAEARAAMRLSPEHFPEASKQAKENAMWACPACRADYPRADLPEHYKCFCGKVRDPAFDPWLLPHTCGETCGRPLPSGCGHGCVLLCHPGPCPPCPRTVEGTCHCGAESRPQRCGKPAWSCGQVCGRTLECGHTCPQPCHDGDCPACEIVGSFECRCGGESRDVRCAERDFQCTRPCGKPLGCGHHACPDVCHSGPCNPCAESQLGRACPCGKVAHPDLSCGEKAPPCGNLCSKLLPCGVHKCEEPCHRGACPTDCRAVVEKTCVCGSTTKTVMCTEEVKCQQRCTKMRACGRHACRKRCCDGNCAPCGETCGKKLRCGNHSCPAPCHSGPCLPCPLKLEVSCACGKSTFKTPCGTESTVAPPKCQIPCPLAQPCQHGSNAHPCHYGTCPPCEKACKRVQECGHPCTVPCHANPPPRIIPPFIPPRRREGRLVDLLTKDAPAAPPPALSMLPVLLPTRPAKLTCPPCSVPISVACVGGHTAVPRACSAGPWTCGAACGAPLACGRHTCSKECHARAGAPRPEGSSAAAGASPEPCDVCTESCGLSRPCGHPCSQNCHPGACEPCAAPLSRKCHCGKSTLVVACTNLQPEESAGDRKVGSNVLSCGKRCGRELINCGHVCTLACHAGPCPEVWTCAAKVTVRCACKRRKAKWPCHEVQEVMQEEMNTRRYIIFEKLPRLLPCDESCRPLPKAKHEPSRAEGVPRHELVRNAARPTPAPEAAAARRTDLPVAERRRTAGKLPPLQPTTAELEMARSAAIAKSARHAAMANARRLALHVPPVFVAFLVAAVILRFLGILEPSMSKVPATP